MRLIQCTTKKPPLPRTLVAWNIVHIAVVGWGRNVLRTDVKWRRLEAKRMKHTRGQVHRQATRDVVGVAGFRQSFQRKTGTRQHESRPWGISREAEIEEFALKRAAIRSVRSSGWANGEDLENSCKK